MTAVCLNIAIGLLTSLIGAAFGWLWQRGRAARSVRSKAAFFGSQRGETCIIVMNNRWDKPGSVDRHDAQAMIEAAVLIRELGCEVSMKASEGFHESNGARMELCIGGPESGSNARAGGHIAHNLPGVVIRPFSSGPDSMAIVANGESFLRRPGDEEHVLVAKFTPPAASRPVILICGQSSVANHAAMAYLTHSYRRIADAVGTTERFCVVLRVESIATYGFHGAVLARDVTASAF